MDFPSAVLTNSVTNGLHAFFLLTYFLFSIYHYKKGVIRSLLIVYFFFFLLMVKILGVVVHYFIYGLTPAAFKSLWIAISIGSLCLDYCILYGQEMPNFWRRAALGLAALLNLIFCVQVYYGEGQFHYIALSLIVIFIVASFYSRGLTRVGFVCTIISNLVWIGMREFVSRYVVNLQTHMQYRYDNDIYHLMLIASTFILYLSLMRGDWVYSLKHHAQDS